MLGKMVSNQRGVVLILTFVIMVTLIVIASSYIFLVTYDTKNLGGQTNNARAFYLAEAGLNKAIDYLLNTAPDSSTDGSWRTTAYPAAAGAGATDPQQEVLGDGTYTMWVETSGSNILITARGTINNIIRTTQQTISLSSGAIEAFNYAVHADGNTNYQNSEGTITGNIGAGNNVQNEDDMTIVGTVTDSSTVLTPTVDTDAYAAIAGNTVNGNHTFSAGTYTGIWYVDGNVSVDSSVTFNGTIVATGKITLDHKGDSIVFNPTAPNPAMVALGNISGDQITNLNISGLVYSTGNISLDKLDATATINGSLISDGNVSMINGSGNFTLTYDSDLAASPPPYFTVPGTGTINAIANTWKEI